jgi:hypothetical protein
MFPGASTDSAGADEPPLDAAEAASATAERLTSRALELERQRVALDAEQALVLAELDARGTTLAEYGHFTAAWLAHEAALPAGVARTRLAVGRKLRTTLPLVAAALAAGRIGWEHARTLADLANPRIAAIVADNQELLLGLADRCRFEQWQAEVRALARMWDQDGGYDPNEDPDADRLSYGRTLDGLLTLAVTLTGERAELVEQAIEAKTDELFRQAVADEKVFPELITPSRRTLRAQALTELIRQALGVDPDTARAPKVEATLVVDAAEPTSASNADGVPLADGTTRVLLCDAELHPVVVDSLSVPLDHGRAIRLADENQRRAVRRRDGGCTFPGCGAKALWCDVHHCVHYGANGVTDLCNLVCLCRRHHGVLHRNGWSIRVDGDGWPIITTPSGRSVWGQRHGRRRDGPPPDPVQVDPSPAGGAQVVTGRYHRIEDPLDVAFCRQATLRRLGQLRPLGA